jgi:hypothetical protein
MAELFDWESDGFTRSVARNDKAMEKSGHRQAHKRGKMRRTSLIYPTQKKCWGVKNCRSKPLNCL